MGTKATRSERAGLSQNLATRTATYRPTPPASMGASPQIESPESIEGNTEPCFCIPSSRRNGLDTR
jgi:hypothetical protein